MKTKYKHFELQENKKEWKDECDVCKEYKFNVHSYYDDNGKVYILCQDCLKKNKLVTLDWHKRPIQKEKEIINEPKKKTSNNKKTTTSKHCKSNKDNSNDENGSKDKRQLLHSGVSRRKSITKPTKHRPGTRKINLI